MLDEDAYNKIMQPSRTKAVKARIKQLSDADHHFKRYRELEQLALKIKPALVVINRFCLHAIQVALAHDIPYVITAPCLPSSLLEYDLPKDYPTPSSGLPLRMTRRQKLRNWYFRKYTQFVFLDRTVLKQAVEFNKHMTELELDPKHIRVRAHNTSAELLLCFSVFGLDYSFPTPDNLRLLGAAIPPLKADPRDHAVMEWLDRQKSVAYTAFGSVTRLTGDQVHSMLDVVRRLGDEHQVLWVLSPDQQRFLPANLRVESWIHSQHSVLAHPNVKVFFTHGGSDSFHEGLHFGKPLLVRAICIDQYDHAARALDSGVGLAVDRPEVMDADDVTAKLRRLLTEESFGERARHFAQAQKDAGGLDTAADLVIDRAYQS